MKKIHITKSQLLECMNKLQEEVASQEGNEVEMKVNPNKLKTNQTSVEQSAKQIAKNTGSNVDIVAGEYDRNGNPIGEGYTLTKKQIKESKLRSLRESCIGYTTKKQLKNISKR